MKSLIQSREDKIVELQAVLPIATGENHKKRTISFCQEDNPSEKD